MSLPQSTLVTAALLALVLNAAAISDALPVGADAEPNPQANSLGHADLK